jgi:type IV pilus assembly protein PilE
MHIHHPRGFSLLELLIALGITAILATLALPSYRQALQRASRQEARLALLRIQGQQERHFTDHFHYATQLEAPADAESLGLEPLSDGGAYALSLQADADGLGYTAAARARGRQSADRDCTVLTLDQTGRRGSVDALGNTRLPDEGRCWN